MVAAAEFTVTEVERGWRGEFAAMASPCQLLLEGGDLILAHHLTALVQTEARRIEQKFSRYRSDNIIFEINHSAGKMVRVDDETAMLLNFADQCYGLSEGLFDVTSGVLRKVWTFDGGSQLPDGADVDALMDQVGWNKVYWNAPEINLRPGMEVDFGGIGKEYAVDRCFERLKKETRLPFLLNFGGDLRASGLRRDGKPWRVGVEHPDRENGSSATIELRAGALATSGDARRFIRCGTQRYGHILNPKTGWPVENAPRSVTVAADTTIEAGILATFSLLQGQQAEAYLQSQQVQYWVFRG